MLFSEQYKSGIKEAILSNLKSDRCKDPYEGMNGRVDNNCTESGCFYMIQPTDCKSGTGPWTRIYYYVITMLPINQDSHFLLLK